MHKWKDNVEFSLDNRQIFFLFFGLSVVGCFVFALGLMVGRRTFDGPRAGAADDALALLEREDALAAAALGGDPEDDFQFPEGLATPATEGLPETRDPSVPPRPDKQVKAARERAKRAGKVTPPTKKRAAKTAKKPPAKVAKKPAKVERKAPAKAPKASAKASNKKMSAPVPAVISRDAASKPAKKTTKTVLASGNPATKGTTADAKGRTFTLQMKAFSKQDDADKLAKKLRSNGHDVRVEAADVRGRTWHRVRVGVFTSWDDALAAKLAFERHEQVIAYVVRL
jgi:cell division protein FtsN